VSEMEEGDVMSRVCVCVFPQHVFSSLVTNRVVILHVKDAEC